MMKGRARKRKREGGRWGSLCCPEEENGGRNKIAADTTAGQWPRILIYKYIQQLSISFLQCQEFYNNLTNFS
jgi:hypothetical protein